MRTLLAVLLLSSFVAQADVFTLYVAPRDSEAHKAAAAKADDKTAFWFPNLNKALQKAIEVLQNSEHEVRVQVSQGVHAGLWALPNGLNAAKGKLLLLGGFCPDWSRKPFACPTELNGGSSRPTPLLGFGGNKTLIQELVISGFVIDSAPSNQYDAKTNSLLKGSSRTIPLIGFSGAVTDHLLVADNVFLNGRTARSRCWCRRCRRRRASTFRTTFSSTTSSR